MKNRLEILLTLLLLLTSLCHVSDAMAYPASSSEETRALVRQLEGRQIARVEILHVDDTLETRTRITPKMLRELTRYRIVIEKPWELSELSGLSTGLNEIQGTKSANPAEVRWALLFFNEEGKETHAVFFSRDGARGLLQDSPIVLNGKLLAWIRGFVDARFLKH
jgi:hypothetical protein